MDLQQRIDYLCRLGEVMKKWDERNAEMAARAQSANPWFTIEHIRGAMHRIASHMLDADALHSFAQEYERPTSEKNVGIVMAGNIPLVGMHDFICGVLSGHRLSIKLSSRDGELLPALMARLEADDQLTLDNVYFVNKLRNIDAVIATGSGNTARYFEYYFGKYPNVIRKNRTSVAILSGYEDAQDWEGLAEDIALYFGMGCRNVSKVYVPYGYDFDPLMQALRTYSNHMLHSKYRNNYDYNFAVMSVNKHPFLTNDAFLFVESEELHPSLSVIYYEFYNDLDSLKGNIERHADQLQCVVTKYEGFDQRINFGDTQKPSLVDFADNVDTMAFLSQL